jgi:hypothetical protein
MSHGRLTQLSVQGILLIVVTIQGIVPDAHDLASMAPLRLFAQMLLGCGAPGQEDEWPDDVCEPVTFASVISRPAGHRLDPSYSPYFDSAIVKSLHAPIDLGLSRLRARPGQLTSFAQPLCEIGCLLC